VSHELLLAHAPRTLVRRAALVVQADTAGSLDAQPRRRREDLEGYLDYLEEELKRVHHEFEQPESNR
jgi:hypothetical protein